jgi:hypothetical protein
MRIRLEFIQGQHCKGHYRLLITSLNPMPPHVCHGLRGLPSRLWLKCNKTSEVGTPMRRGYVVPMKWMVIHEYGVPGGALNLNSTNYPDHGHRGDPPLSGKNPRGRAGNQTWYLMISSKKRWPLDHEAGLIDYICCSAFWVAGVPDVRCRGLLYVESVLM